MRERPAEKSWIDRLRVKHAEFILWLISSRWYRGYIFLAMIVLFFRSAPNISNAGLFAPIGLIPDYVVGVIWFSLLYPFIIFVKLDKPKGAEDKTKD